MGYPQRALASHERLLFSEHPHRIVLLLPISIFLFTTMVASFCAGVVNEQSWPSIFKVISFSILGLLWGIVGALYTIKPIIIWGSTYFIVTDYRLMYREGLLHHRGIDISLDQIASVDYYMNIVDRLVDRGALLITPLPPGDKIEFSNIPHIRWIRMLIDNLLENPSPDHR